jgi:excisionase family DNA binding protein
MDRTELTPVEVAREFNVHPSTVRRWEAAGVLTPTRRLPGSKHRRYSRTAVDALKQALSNPASAAVA